MTYKGYNIEIVLEGAKVSRNKYDIDVYADVEIAKAKIDWLREKYNLEDLSNGDQGDSIDAGTG